jgi:saccharopine dehydrogenase-like NADP-dependent oxidoreductase
LEIDPADISKITIADIYPEGVKARVEELGNPKVSGKIINMDDTDALVRLMEEHDIAVNAAPTRYTYLAVKAALKAGVNIVTLLGPNISYAAPSAPTDEFGQTTEAFLAQLDNDFKKAGLIGIMGMGSMPGTSNVLGRYMGDKFDTIESMEFSSAHAYLGEKKSFFHFDGLAIIRMHLQPALVFREGKPVLLPPRSGRDVAQYPEPIGMVERYYVSHSEVPDFSRHYKDKGIRNVGKKSGFAPEFLSKMEFLDSIGLLDLQPTKVGEVNVVPAEVLVSGAFRKIKKEAKTREYGCIRLEIKGEISGQKIEYIADVLNAPYKNLGGTQHRTGVPASIGVRMIGRGDITRKGCYSPDYGIEPKIYFRELSRREFEFSYTIKYRM